MSIYFRKDFQKKYTIEYNIDEKILMIEDNYNNENKIMIKLNVIEDITQLRNILNEAIQLETIVIKG